MKHIGPSPQTVHWGYFDAALEPVAEIAPGEVILVRSVSGYPDDPVPPEWIPPEIPAIYAEVTDRGRGRMSVEVLHVVRREPGLPQRLRHRTRRAFAVFRP